MRFPDQKIEIEYFFGSQKRVRQSQLKKSTSFGTEVKETNFYVTITFRFRHSQTMELAYSLGQTNKKFYLDS